MSAIHQGQRDHDDSVVRLRGRIDRLASQLRRQHTQGWETNALTRVAQEVERLQTAAARLDPDWASALARIRTPLSAAQQARRLPDAVATGGLIATAEHLLRQLPHPAGEPAPVTRTETPPPGYWRRWTTDAAPAARPTRTRVRGRPANDDASPALEPDMAAAAPSVLTTAEPYRVLIVEDDRAQALFAEGVLNGAGIEALVESDPARVLATMASARSELVLMDLHMPGMSGTELTALIREHPAFLHTPIVFLTGDPDPDRQFEALECGADDFLQKPIRPRHLVAAIESRVKRARALVRHRSSDADRHPDTGLLTVPHLMQQLAAALPGDGRGGVLFIEVEGTASLRERHGYATLERIMGEAGKQLARLAGPCPAARLNDNAFLVHCPELAPADIEAEARRLRDGIAAETIELDGGAIRLRAAIGHVALAHAFADAGSALEAAEQAVREARNASTGLAAYAPPERPDGLRELAADLLPALAEHRFELIYQPIVAVAGGEDAQYQTLLRLHGADGVLHNAGEIVPAAESIGAIADVDRWVLEHALELLRQFRVQQHPLRLFVPQSPRSLGRDGYAEWLAAAMAERELDGPSLVLDLRLPEVMIHSVTVQQCCDQLVPAGVQFCLSQYEHGAEADALLSQLPLGFVRLSTRYAGADEKGDVRDEMRTAIDRAHRRGLQVVGHGVEDPRAAATLWMGGIDYIQGNLVQHAVGELDFDFQHAVL